MGCIDEADVAPAQDPSSSTTYGPATAVYRPNAISYASIPMSESTEVVPAPELPLPAETASLRVFTTTDVGRLTEVIGVLDIRTSADSEDRGFDLLRVRARELGADAVLGAQFVQGKDGAPAHLTGLAVKYLR